MNERIKQELSRSAKNPNSVPNLTEERLRLRELVHQGREEADALRAQEKMLASWGPRRDLLAQTQQQLNAEIEGLKTLRARVEEIDRSIEESRTSLHEASRLEDEASMHEGEPPHELAELVGLSREDQYQLADSLEDFERRRAK